MNFTFLNTLKLDNRYVNIQTNLPVYITLTTIPSRLQNTLKIIKHFLKHVSGFEKIILNIPHQYNRWPDFKVNVQDTINDPRFLLNRTFDYGPLTKLMGSMNIIPDESITIVADDMCYKLDAFKDIAEKQDKERHKSFSFYIYPFRTNENQTNVKVPQGADLISMYTRNLGHFVDWFKQFKEQLNVKNYFDSPCFFVDDQLIGWYFQSHGIPMEQVDRRHRMIYIKGCDVANKSDNLNRQTGERSRENVMNKCYAQLNDYYPI